jgi:hypothetical protein
MFLVPGQCGAAHWLVEFGLPTAAAQSGWMIQHISVTSNVRNRDNTPNTQFSHQYEFWEPFPVAQNATSSRVRDNFQTTGYGQNTSGTHTTIGKVKFYQGTLPPNMFFRNDAELSRYGETGPLTRTRPPFWDDTGTDHNLTLEWDCTGADPGNQGNTRVHAVGGTRVTDL